MKYLIFLFLFFSITSCSHTSRAPNSDEKHSFVDPQDSLLWVGDSQSAGPLGLVALTDMSKKFKTVSVYGVGSSSPRHWANEWHTEDSKWLCNKYRKGRINTYSSLYIASRVCQREFGHSAFSSLNRHTPKFVVFQFLGNSMGLSKQEIDYNVQNLLSQLHDSQKCYFITSPPYHTSKTGNDRRALTERHFIDAAQNRCSVIEGMKFKDFSSDQTNYYNDKVHLSGKGSREFYKLIVNELP